MTFSELGLIIDNNLMTVKFWVLDKLLNDYKFLRVNETQTNE